MTQAQVLRDQRAAGITAFCPTIRGWIGQTRLDFLHDTGMTEHNTLTANTLRQLVGNMDHELPVSHDGTLKPTMTYQRVGEIAQHGPMADEKFRNMHTIQVYLNMGTLGLRLTGFVIVNGAGSNTIGGDTLHREWNTHLFPCSTQQCNNCSRYGQHVATETGDIIPTRPENEVDLDPSYPFRPQATRTPTRPENEADRNPDHPFRPWVAHH